MVPDIFRCTCTHLGYISNQPTELLPQSGNNEELVAFTIRSSVLFYSVLQYLCVNQLPEKHTAVEFRQAKPFNLTKEKYAIVVKVENKIIQEHTNARKLRLKCKTCISLLSFYHYFSSYKLCFILSVIVA